MPRSLTLKAYELVLLILFVRFVREVKGYVATWSDEDTSDDEDYVANLCLMAIEDDSMVTSNSSISIDYTFDELQEAYDELVLVCEESMLKNRKTISKLKVEKDSLSLKLIRNLKVRLMYCKSN
ncbi:hypothetical protein GQ457_13G017080 [Hibiscus cannabinus]